MIIEELIPNTNLEDDKTEFKEAISEGKSEKGQSLEVGWLKTLVGFANAHGGDLYVGVDNRTHLVNGLDHVLTDKTILMVQRLVKEKTQPELRYEVSTIPVKDTSPIRYVIKISVEENKEIPVSLRDKGTSTVYIRNYGSTVAATMEQIRDLILLRDQVPFDRLFTSELYKPQQFSVLGNAFEKKNGFPLSEKALISIGFMDAQFRLSKGALLFKDTVEDSRTNIVACHWPGFDKGSSIINATDSYVGNLIDAITWSLSFIRSRTAHGLKKLATSHVDYYSYPERSLLEGMVNAVAHRNYFLTGTQIEINIFINRLEITSPGALLGVSALKKEVDIASIIPRRRNEMICALLVYCGLMESKGTGFDKIVDDYKAVETAFPPYITTNESSFTLVLPDLTYVGSQPDDTSAILIQTRIPLQGKRDKEILAFCFSTAHSTKEIAEHLSLEYSTYFKNKVLARLANQGYLKAVKQGRKLMYKTNKDMVFLKNE